MRLAQFYPLIFSSFFISIPLFPFKLCPLETLTFYVIANILYLSVQYGFPLVEQFLAGAHAMDTHFFETPLRQNLPVLMGLIGVWNSSFLEHSARAILPCTWSVIRIG